MTQNAKTPGYLVNSRGFFVRFAGNNRVSLANTERGSHSPSGSPSASHPEYLRLLIDVQPGR